MKKLLSFVLAAAMTASMAVTAFAVDYNSISTKYALNPDAGFTSGGIVTKSVGISGTTATDNATQKLADGEKVEIALTAAGAYKNLADFQKDFSLSYKVKSGPVASVALKYTANEYKAGTNGTVKENNYQKVSIEIKFDKILNTEASTSYEVEVSLKNKKESSADALNFKDVTISGSLVNQAQQPAFSEDLNIVFEKANGKIIDFDKFKNSVAEFTFEFQDASSDTVMTVEYKAVQSGKINFAYDVKQNAAIVNKYADVDFEFINFLAAPKLAKVANIKFYSDYAKGGVFQVEADGTVRNLGAKYNSAEGAYEFKSSTLGTFFVASDASKIATVSTSSSSAAASSEASSSATTGKTNVNTGASDIVNVAVVMSVVSLAAAGAVAFKKASK